MSKVLLHILLVKDSQFIASAIVSQTVSMMGIHLDERHGLDVTHSAAQLNDTHVRLLRPAVHRFMCYPLYPVL